MNTRRETVDFSIWKRRKLESDLNSYIAGPLDGNLDSETITNLFDMLKEWHTFYYSGKLEKIEKDVLISLIMEMYLSNFEDSKYVSEVLKLIYEVEGNFNWLLVTTVEMLRPPRSTNTLEIIKYFLHHSYKTQSLFDGYRLPCTEVYFSGEKQHPVEFAVFKADPLLLHELLRYGALLSYNTNYSIKRHRILRFAWNGLMILICLIELIIKFNPDVLPLTDLSLTGEVAEKYQNHVSCCKLLLRDFPHYNPRCLKIINASKYMIKKKDMPDFIKSICYNVVPQLESHFMEPMKLKHTCRQIIRKRLNEKWFLPNGIYDLPLPMPLKKYLDLYYD